MRAAAVVALLFLVASCGAETNVPGLESAATSAPTTAATSTTTKTEATSEPAQVCEEATRGFQCPPHLLEGSDDLVGRPIAEALPAAPHAAGTYRTRLFKPPLEFTRQVDFRSQGEGSLYVNLFIEGCARGQVVCKMVSVISSSAPEGLPLVELPDPSDCVGVATITETKVFGLPSDLLDVTTVPAADCVLDLPLGTRLALIPGERAHLYQVDLGGSQPHVVIVLATTDDFDRFLTEEAQPLLDTVRVFDN